MSNLPETLAISSRYLVEMLARKVGRLPVKESGKHEHQEAMDLFSTLLGAPAAGVVNEVAGDDEVVDPPKKGGWGEGWKA